MIIVLMMIYHYSFINLICMKKISPSGPPGWGHPHGTKGTLRFAAGITKTHSFLGLTNQKVGNGAL